MTSDRPKIVTGVDGSEASKDALRWAARQADVTDGRLQVILAWRQPVTYGYPPDYSDADFEKDARQTLDTVLSDVLGTPSTVPVDARVIEGHAAPILLEAAHDADLLVVGSHGHGAFIGMLMGSTSQHCVHHATCPVVVVRHPSKP